jgi:hypothetical protein
MLDSHEDALGHAARTLRTTIHDDARTARVLSSLAHMSVNRMFPFRPRVHELLVLRLVADALAADVHRQRG